jgi:hypothetical protein
MPSNFRAVQVRVFGSILAQTYVSEMTAALLLISGRLISGWKLRMRAEATGREQRSPRAKVTGSPKKLLLQVYSTDWAAFIDEVGRQAGATMAPFSEGDLLRWVVRKGLGASAYSTTTRRPIVAGTVRSVSQKTGQLRSKKQSLKAKQRSIAFLISRKQSDQGQPAQRPAERTLIQERNYIWTQIALARDRVVNKINSGTP